MNMDYKLAAQNINEHFGVYGYGHFNITTDELAEILQAAFQKDATILIADIYAKLERLRMG